MSISPHQLAHCATVPRKSVNPRKNVAAGYCRLAAVSTVLHNIYNVGLRLRDVFLSSTHQRRATAFLHEPLLEGRKCTRAMSTAKQSSSKYPSSSKVNISSNVLGIHSRHPILGSKLVQLPIVWLHSEKLAGELCRYCMQSVKALCPEVVLTSENPVLFPLLCVAMCKTCMRAHSG